MINTNLMQFSTNILFKNTFISSIYDIDKYAQGLSKPINYEDYTNNVQLCGVIKIP